MSDEPNEVQPWRCLFCRMHICRMHTGVRLFRVPVCHICRDPLQDFFWASGIQGALVGLGLLSGVQEAFEARTLLQTHRIPHFPVLFFGEGFWADLDRQLDRLEADSMISAHDRARVRRIETAEQAVAILEHCHHGLCRDLGKPPLRPRPA